MFTGIVTAVGSVADVTPNRLGIEHPPTARSAAAGASIAVNGVCLTVTATDDARNVFFADVVPETLSRTNLGALRPGDPVNLEPPLRLDQGLDGHLVQGHVDGTGTVRSVSQVVTGREVTIALPAELARFVAEKGSIAVDGTSLTVAQVTTGDPPTFTVALIPHTLEQTIARTYRAGSTVNLEVDVIARYAERLLASKHGQ